MQKRYLVIADYPYSIFKVGLILHSKNNDEWFWVDTNDESYDNCSIHNNWIKKCPNIFRELHWWEMRTLDELMSVKYVKITIYTGYWVVGDIVNVTDYKIDSKNKKFLMYILDGTQHSLPERCKPATENEYNEYQKLKQ